MNPRREPQLSGPEYPGFGANLTKTRPILIRLVNQIWQIREVLIFNKTFENACDEYFFSFFFLNLQVRAWRESWATRCRGTVCSGTQSTLHHVWSQTDCVSIYYVALYNLQGSHFFGLTKFHHISMIFPGFISKFPGIFFIILKV